MHRWTLSSFRPLILLAASPLLAQPMALDLDFAPSIEHGSSVVTDLRYSPAPNRQLIAFGGATLTHVNNVAVSHATARLNPDGSLDATFRPRLNLDEVIRDAVVLPDGRMLVATASTTQLTPPRVLRLLASGEPDPAFPPLALTGAWASVARLSDGSAIVWGSFSAIGDVARNSLARILPDGSVDPAFVVDFTDGALTVLSLTVTGSDHIVFSAQAYRQDQPLRRYLHRLTPSGAVDPSFAPATPTSTFSFLGGASDNRLVISNGSLQRLRADGSVDPTYSTEASALGQLRHAIPLPGNRLAVELATASTASGPISAVFILSPDGAVELDCRQLPGAERIQTLRGVRSDGSIAIAQGPLIREVPRDSKFVHLLPGMHEPKLCVIDPIARTLTPFSTTFENVGRGSVRRLSLDGADGVVVEGHFTRVAGERRSGLARFHLDGTLDSTFAPVAASPLFHLPDGRMIATQRKLSSADSDGFHSYDNQIIRLNRDGTLDATFAPRDDAELLTATWLAAASDGRILVCLFENGVSAEPNAKLVWLAPDGTRDTTLSTTFAGFMPPPPPSGVATFASPLASAALLPDAKLLLRVLASTINGEPSPLLVRLNADGTTDFAYQPDIAALQHVTDATPLSDGRAYVSGIRVGIDSSESDAVLRLNPDGSPDTFVEPVFARGIPLSDGSFIYEAERFHADGTRDLNFELQIDHGYALQSAVLAPDGLVWIGGFFGEVDHQPRSGLARLRPAVVAGFTVQPLGTSSYAGSPATFAAEIGTAAPATFQWTHNGTPIPGATNRSLTVPRTRASDAGEYRLVAIVGGTTYTSNPAVLTVRVNDTRLVNFSARSRVAAGGAPQICGFVLRTPAPRSILLRALGQGLPAEGLGELLPRPVLRLYRDGLFTAEDAGSALQPSITAIFPRIGATPSRPMYPPDGSGNALPTHDSALLTALPDGVYTVHTSSGDDQSGVSLFELYDAGETAGPALVKNVSIRARTAPGQDVLIAGFVIAGAAPTQVLIRGLGPELARTGVSDTIADPQIALYRESSRLAFNDQWNDQTDVAEIIAATARVGASPLPSDSRDAVLWLTLPPGVYTVHGSGTGGATGEMMIELFVGEE